MIPLWHTKVASCCSTSAQIVCVALSLVSMAVGAEKMRPITGAPNPPSALELGIVEEIYTVFPKNEETFFLTRPLKAPREELEALGFLTPQSLILSQNYELEPRTEGAFDRVTCEQQFTFGIWSMSNVLGKFIVGICGQQANHIDEVARNGGKQLKRVLELLKVPLTEKSIRAGLVYETSSATGGALMYYYPVIVVAPGGVEILQITAVVKSDRSRAIVVQLDAGHTCNRDPRNESNLPVCSDVKNKLQQLIQRLAQRYGS